MARVSPVTQTRRFPHTFAIVGREQLADEETRRYLIDVLRGRLHDIGVTRTRVLFMAAPGRPLTGSVMLLVIARPDDDAPVSETGG